MKTRSRTDIIGIILQAVKDEPLTRSKIMYETLLNFRQVRDYCVMLEDAGLLTHLKENRLYRITEKGRIFLGLYDESSKILQQYQEIQ